MTEKDANMKEFPCTLKKYCIQEMLKINVDRFQQNVFIS